MGNETQSHDEHIVVDGQQMRGIGKQIRLPWSKAAEIAFKSMKIRFGRSVVTTASIVLAIAFLMSILTTTTLITSLKTKPVRRVVEYRDRARDAEAGKDIGLVFPEDLSADDVKARISTLESQLAGKKLRSLDKVMAKAELPLAKAERDVLESRQAVAKSQKKVTRLEKQLADLARTEVDEDTAKERLNLVGLPITPEIRQRDRQIQGWEVDLAKEQKKKDTEEVKKLAGQIAAAREELVTLLPPVVEAGLARERKELARLKRTETKRIARAIAAWKPLQANADQVRMENEWTQLWRTLQEEGYTDVELKIVSAPPKASFIEVMAKHMEPRDLWLAILATLVCLVGIMNAMLMSVHERFREIGTMKCLGALESFIVKLYFLESSFIGLVGTLMGILVGFLLAMVRSMAAFGFGRVLSNFDWGGALLSALCTLLIGSLLSVIAAILPARSAAKMDPVVAMRVDE